MQTVISDLLIEHVSIKPNRYGRHHPWLSLINESQCSGDVSHIPLRSIGDLERYDCYEGDVVDLVLVNGIVSRIDKKYPSMKHITEVDYDLVTLQNGQCCCCLQKGIQHQDALYCINQCCVETNVHRAIYACTPRVLDIPLSSWDIRSLQLKNELGSPTPVADLLNGIDREELSGIKYDEELDEVLEVINRRHRQLRGIGYPHYVQVVIQGRHLAALSLRGLFKMHINKIMKALLENRWSWQNISIIMTDGNSLIDVGIPVADAKIIAQAAVERIEEIKAFANL